MGRDRKLRDHNKTKIFREIVTNLFETKIEPAKLLYFLESKCKEKKDTFSYNYSRDTNLLNLRFCVYLLSEELETIIDNLDESRGNNYINSVDAKLEKRNEIINYLLREKAVTQKLFSRVLSVLTNLVAENGDLLVMIEGLSDRADRGRMEAKVKLMSEDLRIVEELKAYVKAYFTEKDLSNLLSLQRDLPNPLTREEYLRISEFVPVFDRIDRYQQLLDEYRSLSRDMALKEENYSRLLKKYDELLKDFTELTVQGSKQIINPLGPEDYDQIFSRYKEVKEQQDKSAKDQAMKVKATSGTKISKKAKESNNGKRSKSKLGDEEAKPVTSKKSKIIKKKSKSKQRKAVAHQDFEEDEDTVHTSREDSRLDRMKTPRTKSPMKGEKFFAKSRSRSNAGDHESHDSIRSVRHLDESFTKSKNTNLNATEVSHSHASPNKSDMATRLEPISNQPSAKKIATSGQGTVHKPGNLGTSSQPNNGGASNINERPPTVIVLPLNEAQQPKLPSSQNSDLTKSDSGKANPPSQPPKPEPVSKEIKPSMHQLESQPDKLPTSPKQSPSPLDQGHSKSGQQTELHTPKPAMASPRGPVPPSPSGISTSSPPPPPPPLQSSVVNPPAPQPSLPPPPPPIHTISPSPTSTPPPPPPAAISRSGSSHVIDAAPKTGGSAPPPPPPPPGLLESLNSRAY